MNISRIGAVLMLFVFAVLLKPTSVLGYALAEQANGKRVALVIGNKNYLRGALDNPWNDANVMDSVLRQLGFAVTLRFDLSRKSMSDEIQALADRSAGAEAVLVYFSGHGVQDKGRNFLLPTNVALSKSSSIPEVSVSVDRALETIEKVGAKVNIFILDACRNAPFEEGLLRTTQAGLGEITPPRGTLIAFSTSPGGVASDGKVGSNSAFTAALARTLAEPKRGAEAVFKRVREMVSAQSNGKEVPWLNSGLTGEFIFNTGKAVVKIPELPMPTASFVGSERKRAASSTNANTSDRWREVKSPEQWAQLDFDIDQRAKRVTVDDLSELAGRAYDREAKAQVMLGDAYQIGIRSGAGWIRSNQDAMLWYRRAAAQGYPLAQVRIGEMYGESRGVDRDLVEAKRWFALAAAQGLQRAKVNLMQANLLGSGVLPSGGEMLDMIKGLTPQANTKNKAGSN